MRNNFVLDYIPLSKEYVDEHTYYNMNNEATIYAMREKFNQLISEV